jgi:hypothetical protein
LHSFYYYLFIFSLKFPYFSLSLFLGQQICFFGFLFNVPRKIVVALGITRFESEAAFDGSLVSEGVTLIGREKPFFYRKVMERRTSEPSDKLPLPLQVKVPQAVVQLKKIGVKRNYIGVKNESERLDDSESDAERTRSFSKNLSIREKYADRFKRPEYQTKATTKSSRQPVVINLSLDKEIVL